MSWGRNHAKILLKLLVRVFIIYTGIGVYKYYFMCIAQMNIQISKRNRHLKVVYLFDCVHTRFYKLWVKKRVSILFLFSKYSEIDHLSKILTLKSQII